MCCMGICGSGRNGRWSSRMSYKRKPPIAGSESQDLWMDVLAEMGGQFWPPIVEEEDMPQVGARFPMMLYNATLECIVYDEEEYEEAKRNGYNEHPALMSEVKPDVVQASKKPEPHGEVKP